MVAFLKLLMRTLILNHVVMHYNLALYFVTPAISCGLVEVIKLLMLNLAETEI